MTPKATSVLPLVFLLAIFECFIVSKTIACPSHCTCTTKDGGSDSDSSGGGGGGEIIDCSGKRFVSLPAALPKSTVTLDLSDNLLGPLMNSSFTQYMQSLTDLDLSYNGLQELLACTLSGMRSLKSLKLRGNKLRVMLIF